MVKRTMEQTTCLEKGFVIAAHLKKAKETPCHGYSLNLSVKLLRIQ